ncbi:MAG: hypothetical protein A2W47_04360 [Gammaproteobacteria bacterium RIFCSPHIGHO2_12_38_15]|nr:MAG: hypothetical protein A2W47_04360 [Gammaproteobacteria bacterium RIFCSPHIGHO2_12_38_15]
MKKEKKQKLNYHTLGINCVNGEWPASWLTDNECCECDFECKIKVFEIKSGYEYVITKREYEKLLTNKQIDKF